jgi:hypothetical protein
MSIATERKPDTEIDAVGKIAALPTVNTHAESPPESYAEEIATIKKSFFSVISIFAGLFLVSMIFSPKYNSYHRSQGSVAPPQAVSVASATTVTPHAHHRHLRSNQVVVHDISYPEELKVHHLYGQDYSLTWKSMGDQYTYRVFYADNKQMQDAMEVFYRPVVGTLYRFTIGDPKNVWLAIVPVDGNGHELAFSQPLNIAQATESH